MFDYPAGHRRASHKTSTANIQRSSPKKKAATRYGSRGISLEERINNSNQYYLAQNIAVIHKKPTPVQVVKVDYPRRSAAKIVEAYYRHASTTDYNGVYQGKYIDFEVKETKNKTSFPLANIPEHQIAHMQNCYNQGGYVFLIISFSSHDKVFLLPFAQLRKHLDHHQQQSLTYEFIEENGFECPQGIFPMIDYLEALENYIDTQMMGGCSR